MPVETIECQIVQGQLGRYLAGDLLPAEVVRELERHIGGCPICRTEVANRRATLHALLGVGPEAPEANPLLDLLRQRSSSTSTMPTHAATPHLAEPASVETELTLAPRRLFTKPLLLSAGLAIVLIAMNVLTNGPTDVLGPRANAAVPTPKTTVITPLPTSTVEDRLFRADWESFAVADLAEFDADLSDVMPAWQWLALDIWTEAPIDADVEAGLVEESSDAVDGDAPETAPVIEPPVVQPTPAPTPTATRSPRPSSPRPVARPRVTEPAPRPEAPAENKIRVYPPES